MRKHEPRPKVAVAEPVPQALGEFLREVVQLIDQGDPAATTESDDLLQADSVVGGLADAGTNLYAFTYFPGAGVESPWYVELTASQIRTVARGELSMLPLWRCQAPECGSRFSAPTETCFSCDYHEE